MDYELLGKRIRDERLLLRLTIEQLAERVDKSTNYIGQIERNDGTIQEISTLLYSLDDNGKQFILDVVKRYSHYHQSKSNNL